jgi:hypothetical protein
MKSLKEIIFTFVVVTGLGLGLSVHAQGDDQKKPPKNPPVIKPGDKPKPPKGGGKPKKPGMSFYLVSGEAENDRG